MRLIGMSYDLRFSYVEFSSSLTTLCYDKQLSVRPTVIFHHKPRYYRFLISPSDCCMISFFPSLKETSVLGILCNNSADIDMFTIISNYTEVWRPKEIIRNGYRCFGMLIGTMVINQQALLTSRISKTGDRNPAFWRI